MANDLLRSAVGLGKLILIVAIIALPACSRRVISVEQVDRMIKDQVPIGSDKQKVKDFIDNLRVDSLKIGRDADFQKADCVSLGTLDKDKTDALGDRIAESMGAVIYKSESDGILTFDNIVIVFYIDKEGRTLSYTVKEWGSD